jgi:tetratricopeptide (TPR) repeat protein
MFREDYIIRLIKQLAEFIARAAGLNRSGKYDEALAATDQAWDQLLDAPRGMIAAVDTPTLAMLLRDPAKIRVAAQLSYEEGRALAGKGDPFHAALRYRRAMELILEARARDPQPEDDAAILELGRHVSIDTLDPRYRAPASPDGAEPDAIRDDTEH